MSVIARSREMAKKREEKEKSKHKFKTLVYKRGGKDIVYRKVGDDYFRVKEDGTLAKAPAAHAILSALNTGPSHQFISLPSDTQKKRNLALGILKTLRGTSTKENKKGQAQASTLDGTTSTTTVKKDKKQKKEFVPFLLNKKDKEVTQNKVEKPIKEVKTKKPIKEVKTEKPIKEVKTKNVKETITKKLKEPPKVDKKETKTPNLKPFQGSYNQDTQKLVNIKGKTFVAPKSYEKPKSKTNPSFKRLLKSLGLNKGSYVGKPRTGHSDYRKSGLFK